MQHYHFLGEPNQADIQLFKCKGTIDSYILFNVFSASLIYNDIKLLCKKRQENDLVFSNMLSPISI